MDCSPTGSSVHGISQARRLDWVAISFSRDLPHPGFKPMSPVWQVDSSPRSHQLSPFLPLCVCVFVCVCVTCSAVSDSLRHHGLQPSRLLCPWDSPGKDTGVACHSLPRRSARTQDSNLGLLHCRQILYLLRHQGSPFLPMHTVYSCAFLLISYMLGLCVSV